MNCLFDSYWQTSTGIGNILQVRLIYPYPHEYHIVQMLRCSDFQDQLTAIQLQDFYMTKFSVQIARVNVAVWASNSAAVQRICSVPFVIGFD